jgi:hypothetical protein
VARKRRQVYPPKRTPPKVAPASGDPVVNRSGAVSIDLSAMAGRTGLSIGDRVRILGTGLYAGEIATIDRFANGVVPAAVVKTEAGRTRQVRTIDLEPVREG